MECSAQEHLRPGILPTDAGHHSRAGLLVDNVGHDVSYLPPHCTVCYWIGSHEYGHKLRNR
jgi:hypothetical protein